MDSSDLSADQAAKLYLAVRPTLDFLSLVRERMTRLGFDPADRLFRLVCRAQEATDDLADETHRLACSNGSSPDHPQ